MKIPQSLRVGLFASFVAAAACGGKSSVDRDLAGLIPADTVAVARIASIDELERHARDVATAAGESTEQIDAGMWLQQLGGLAGNTELIDRRRPIAFAMSLPRGGQPAPVVLVPTTDGTAYAASLPPLGAQPVVAGGYVAVPLGGKYTKPAAPSTAMDGLPDGLLAVRADLEKITTAFGAPISMALTSSQKMMASQLEKENVGVDGEALAELYVGMARALLEAAKQVELTFDYRDGRLDAFAALTVKPGSDLDGWSSAPVDLSALAGRMSGKGAIEVVVVGDWQKLAPRYEALMAMLLDLYPPKERDLMRTLMGAWPGAYGAMGQALAMEGGLFGEGGIDVVMQMSPPDAAAMAKALDATFSHDALGKLGVSIETKGTAGKDGAVVHDYAVKVDASRLAALAGGEPARAARFDGEAVLRAMFGGDELPMRYAGKGNAAMVAIGKASESAEALASLRRSDGAFSQPVQTALARVADCNPLLIERLDIAAIMSSMARLAREMGGPSGMPAPAAGLTADIVVSGGIRGNEWRAGFAMDVTGFARLIRSTMPR